MSIAYTCFWSLKKKAYIRQYTFKSSKLFLGLQANCYYFKDSVTFGVKIVTQILGIFIFLKLYFSILSILFRRPIYFVSRNILWLVSNLFFEFLKKCKKIIGSHFQSLLSGLVMSISQKSEELDTDSFAVFHGKVVKEKRLLIVILLVKLK